MKLDEDEMSWSVAENVAIDLKKEELKSGRAVWRLGRRSYTAMNSRAEVLRNESVHFKG
jgi:hypothetical protein